MLYKNNDTFPFSGKHHDEYDFSNIAFISWSDHFDGRDEPDLREIMDDPIMRCLLKSDKLTVENIMKIVHETGLTTSESSSSST